MVTIRDIAQKAGVSKSTVALALRNDHRCSSKTTDLVRRVADDLGYKPNPLVAANMANMRWGKRRKRVEANLAYFYDCMGPNRDRTVPFDAAKEHANELGYSLEKFAFNDPQLSKDRLYQMLRYRNVQGIIIGSHPDPIPHIDFHWDDFAIAAIGYTLQHPRVHRVGYDHAENIRHLFEQLHERNYRKVGLAMERNLDDRVSHSITANYLGHQAAEFGVNSPPMFIGGADWNAENFNHWVSSHKPDCIITVGSQIKEWLVEAGYRIPDDIGLVSIWGHRFDPIDDINHYVISIKQLARIAVDVVTDQLYSNQRGIPEERRSILVSSVYNDCNSLRSLDTKSAGLV